MNESNGPTPAARFWRLMAVMAVVALIAAAAALYYMHRQGTPLHLHFVIAMTAGIVATLLLAGALMGLLFFSARSGHDAAVSDIDDPDDLDRG
jgi:anti-sigma-K factor RskA